MTRSSSLAALLSGFLASAIGCGSVDTVDHSSSQATSGTGGAPPGSSSSSGGDSGGGGSGSGSVTSSSTASADGAGGSGCVPLDDGNACTIDACLNGVETHTSTPAGNVCASDGAVCDGMGNCAVCPSPSVCPGQDTACQTRICESGSCGFAFAPAGTPLPMQILGDCQQFACDGNGLAVTLGDSTDAPDDLNPCTVDVCTAGAPAHVAKPQGTTCGPNLVCDGGGACVGCNTPTDCPGVDDACHTRTCTAGQCGVIISPVPVCAMPACTGTLGFAEGPPMPIGANSQSVLAGDLSGDGKPDLVVANTGGATVSVLLGNGNGTYSNTVSVLLNSGASGFAAKVDYAPGSIPVIALGDVNGDGPLDLVVAVFNGSGVSVLLGNGDGTFGANTNHATSQYPSSIAVKDLNGDGRADLAIPEGGSTLRALLNVCFP